MSTTNASQATQAASNANAGTTQPSNSTQMTTVTRNHKVKCNVPFLDNKGSDYGQWSFCSQLVLQSCDLWGVIDGSYTLPDRTSDPTAYDDWMQKDMAAQIQISTPLKKGPFAIIADANTAKECWDKLTDHFRGKGEQHVAYCTIHRAKNWAATESLRRSSMMNSNAYVLWALKSVPSTPKLEKKIKARWQTEEALHSLQHMWPRCLRMPETKGWKGSESL